MATAAHSHTVLEQVPPALQTTDHSMGLCSAEVQRRLQQFGANAGEDARTPIWQQFLGKLWGAVPWMLEAVIALQILFRRVPWTSISVRTANP